MIKYPSICFTFYFGADTIMFFRDSEKRGAQMCYYLRTETGWDYIDPLNTHLSIVEIELALLNELLSEKKGVHDGNQE